MLALTMSPYTVLRVEDRPALQKRLVCATYSTAKGRTSAELVEVGKGARCQGQKGRLRLHNAPRCGFSSVWGEAISAAWTSVSPV